MCSTGGWVHAALPLSVDGTPSLARCRDYPKTSRNMGSGWENGAPGEKEKKGKKERTVLFRFQNFLAGAGRFSISIYRPAGGRNRRAHVKALTMNECEE